MATNKSQNVFSSEQKTEIYDKALSQFRLSHNTYSAKKDLFRERKPLIANIEKWDDKLNVNTLDWIIRTLLALYYMDELTVEFKWQNPYVWEAWEEWNNVAKNDYTEMDMEYHDFKVQLDRFSKWVGIRHVYDRDAKNNLILFDVVDPETRRPSPGGRGHPNEFNFMWFDRTVYIDELQNQTQLELSPSEITEYISDEEQQRMYSDTYGRMISDQAKNPNQVTLYYHYMYYDSKCVQVLMLWSKWLQIKTVDPLLAMMNDEKNKYNLKRPVSLNYWRPLKWDAFGLCVFDVAEDKQKFKTLLMNLMKIKAIKQALWWTLFVDSEIYRGNKSLLTNPTKTTKIIPVTNMVDKSVQNSVFALPEDQVWQDSYNLLNLINTTIEEDTSISNQVRWLTPEKEMTRAEVQDNRHSSDVNLLLANKVNARGEKQFYELMYIYYKHYFDSSSKKYVEINRGYTSTWIYYSRKELFDIVDPRITILNKSVVDGMNVKMVQAFQITYLQDIQDPTIPEISKRYLKRKYKRLLAWMNRHELDIIHPPSPEELKAKRDLLLLNRNLPVKVRNMQESHIDYIIIYSLWLPTPANKASTEMRIKAYIASWQAQQLQQAWMQQWWGQWGMVNSMWNQLVANSLQNQPQ